MTSRILVKFLLLLTFYLVDGLNETLDLGTGNATTKLAAAFVQTDGKHMVDIVALRQFSIDSYLARDNFDDLAKHGLNRQDTTMSLVFIIFSATFIFMGCCFQAQRSLMRELYMDEKERKKAVAENKAD